MTENSSTLDDVDQINQRLQTLEKVTISILENLRKLTALVTCINNDLLVLSQPLLSEEYSKKDKI